MACTTFSFNLLREIFNWKVREVLSEQQCFELTNWLGVLESKRLGARVISAEMILLTI